MHMARNSDSTPTPYTDPWLAMQASTPIATTAPMEPRAGAGVDATLVG